MTTLKELAPRLLQTIEEAQHAILDYHKEQNRYGMLELINSILNDSELVQAMNEVRESMKPSENPNEKFWPESGMIEKTEYEPNNNVLVITFKNGNKYGYQDFPAHKWDDLKATESIGKYVNSAIKGTYTSQKLETVNSGGL